TILIILGWVTIAHSVFLRLRFLNPWSSSSEESNPPPTPKICKPVQTTTTERAAVRFLSSEQETTPSVPEEFASRRPLVPLPTLKPSTTTTTTQISRETEEEDTPSFGNQPFDCDPQPIGFATRFGTSFLKIFTRRR
ncbi:hypothetical protein KR018_007117, partial [Drosophila ironensis]